MKKIILNQKSYLLYDEMINCKNNIDNLCIKDYEIILFPPIMYLSMFKNSLYSVGTQNFYSSKVGSFTGEVNLEALKNIGINYTMIGHYERHKIIDESYEMTKEKLFRSLNSKCNTILCVGETKKTKRPFSYIKRELNYYLRAVEKSNIKYLSIAYEPNWAVGSGEIQCIDKISKVIADIKLYIKSKYKFDIEVYYGGSIDRENIKNILNVCDGVVLGKISTEYDELNELINEIK